MRFSWNDLCLFAVLHPLGAELGCPTIGHQNIWTSTGLIASVTTEETGLGSPGCPWRITVRPHQRINLTLIEFNPSPPTSLHPYSMDNSYLGQTSSSTVTSCDNKYALISERNKTRTVSVCGGRMRETSVFLSETNVVEVVIPTLKGTSVPGYFLLKYEGERNIKEMYRDHLKYRNFPDLFFRNLPSGYTIKSILGYLKQSNILSVESLQSKSRYNNQSPL